MRQESARRSKGSRGNSPIKSLGLHDGSGVEPYVLQWKAWYIIQILQKYICFGRVAKAFNRVEAKLTTSFHKPWMDFQPLAWSTELRTKLLRGTKTPTLLKTHLRTWKVLSGLRQVKQFPNWVVLFPWWFKVKKCLPIAICFVRTAALRTPEKTCREEWLPCTCKYNISN